MEIFAIFPIIIVVGIIVAIVLLSKAGFTIESGKGEPVDEEKLLFQMQ